MNKSVFDPRPITPQLQRRAESLGAKLFLSHKPKKHFMVEFDGKMIQFGAKFPAITYIDHGDMKLRNAWRARHSKILSKGRPAYTIKTSPEYWSWNLLWL